MRDVFFATLNDMDAKAKVGIINFFIPVYFDIESFILLRSNILLGLGTTIQSHFYLLDDSSGRDPHLSDVQKMKDVTIVTMPHNIGHQKAIVFGLRDFFSKNRSESLIVTMDGDGEDRPEDLPRLLEAYLELGDNRSLVLAKRTERNETYFFKFFYFLYKHLFRLLTGTIIQTGNFAMMSSVVAQKNLSHPFFDLSYASSLFALGSNTIFVPCARGTRYFGKSKMNFPKLASHGVFMLMPFMDKIAIRGIIFFAIMNLLSALSLLLILFLKINGYFAISPWLIFSDLLFFTFTMSSILGCGILMTLFVNIQGIAQSKLMRGDYQHS